VISSKVQVSDYCDFCLGDLTKNASGKAEELVSCHGLFFNPKKIFLFNFQIVDALVIQLALNLLKIC